MTSATPGAGTHKPSSPTAMPRVSNVPAVWGFVAGGLLAIFYLATSVHIASHRLLCFDEILTVHIARLPHWASIRPALAHGADGQPPLHYLMARLFDNLPLQNEVAVRLPSALELAAGFLIIFDYSRRLTRHYSRQPEKCILLLPSGFKQGRTLTRYLTHRLLLNLSRYYRLQFASPDDLREHAHETALIQPTQEVLAVLTGGGLKIETRFSQPLEVVYLKSATAGHSVQSLNLSPGRRKCLLQSHPNPQR